MTPTSDGLALPRSIGAYLLLELIGRGAMGEVYRALDSAGSPVAIKRIRPELAADATVRDNFLREARAAARLVHPNIVRLLDVGEDDGGLFLVLEHVDGAPLTQWRTHPPDMVTIRTVLLQILQALAHAHARGIVHRDLKPENILLSWDSTGEAVARILDFGVAHFREEGAGTEGPSFVGTPEYMSPEQVIDSRDVSPASDLYAVGIIAWEALTGRLPFRGSSPEATAVAQVNQPLPVLEVGPGRGWDDATGEWLQRMLAKDPDRRFRFATDARDALSRCHGWDVAKDPRRDLRRRGPAGTRASQDSSGAAPTLPPSLPLGGTGAGAATPLGMIQLRDAPFVGRAEEVGELARLLAWVLRTRQGALLALSGAAGAGKSRLCQHLGETVEEAGLYQVWRGSLESDAAPWAGLLDGVRDGLRLKGVEPARARDRLERWLRRHHVRDPWEQAASRELLLGAGEGGGSRLLKRREAQWALLVRMFRRACTDRPVLMVLENLHRDDGSVVAFLASLQPQLLEEFPLVVLGTWRIEAPGAADLPSRWSGLGGVHVALPPLPVSELERMLTEHVGMLPQVNRRLAAASSGNPRMALQMLRFCVESGVLRADDVEQRLAEVLPESLHQLLALRLEEVLSSQASPETVLTIWRLVALLPTPVSRGLLDRAVSAVLGPDSMPNVGGALWAGSLAGLLDQDREGHLTLESEAWRETLVGRLSPGERVRLHAACGVALAASGAVRDPSQCMILAGHWREAGRWEEASAWYAEGARRAARHGEPALALQAWEHVLGLVPHLAAGEGPGTAHALQGDAWQGCAELMMQLGEVDSAEGLVDRLAGLGGSHTMEAERLRGLLALQRGRLPQARAWLSRVDAMVAGQSAPPLQARSHLDLATLELADGHADRAESHLRAARAGYAALGDRRGELAATQALGEVACRLGLWEEATRCLEEACQGWDADPDLHAATTCRLRLCEVAVMQQHGEGVAAHLAALRSTFEALGDIRALGQVSLTEGRLALGTGSSDEAGPLFARAAELADATEDWAGGTLARLGRGLAACAGGRGAEAAGWWREALARDARQRVEDVRVGPMLMQAARSSVGMGETELALALLESLRHKLSRNRDGGADSDLADEADWLVYELTEGTGSGVHMLGGGKPGEDDEG